MQRTQLPAVFATLLLSCAIGEAAAQAPQQPVQQGQQGQQGQQPQPAQVFPQQQPAGQPLLVVPSLAPPAPAGPGISPDLPNTELAPLLARVERESDKQFMVDPRVGSRLYLGGVEPDDVTYPVLLAIFRLNGFAAFESEGFVNIVPDANIRFHAPIIERDDPSIPPDLYVTRVLTTTNIGTAQLVPILRPMMPPSAHLASHVDSNRLIVMDRYENLKRIEEIVRSLDVAPRN
jgi:general secretion pathway protein D